MTGLEIIACGPLVTVQDRGRPGWLSQGLAQGGAADRAALDEADALLGEAGAGIETPGAPLAVRLGAAAHVALTGAPMRATADGAPVEWNTATTLPAGTRLELKPTGAGVYSYLHVAGGFATAPVLGSRAAHLIARIGRALVPGDVLPYGPSDGPARRVQAMDRLGGGVLRIVPGPQTALFPPEVRDRFTTTAFIRDPRGNRQGVRLAMAGAGFETAGQLGLLSDFIRPGDVQMTGDGVPYILGPECQTTGGYPRIGTVIAADLPRALQAPPGAPLTLRFVTREVARAARWGRPRTAPLIRDPRALDLNGEQLIGGVISARDA
ncbi:biotin-dependent carboxyltransferase family protein [Jannaschia sp. KMU-145]|uniref:5-oxoprolinase subunit C family protein n=1 Tax=Jannaschia halovivens TaxID=3388667 RepID=UPI00396AF93F